MIIQSLVLVFLASIPSCTAIHTVAGRAYSDSCTAALLLATRGGSDTEYTGHSYGDSRAVAEDSHYHGNPDQYQGRSSEDIPRGTGHEEK